MLSFELSAIDLILVISVIVLLILYLTKVSGKTPEEKYLRQSITENASPERPVSRHQRNYIECPHGFGNIEKLGDDGSVSEKCLGCDRIKECYSEKK